jgi:hypothetical protein
MRDYSNLDDEARTELLTYLVVSQLIARADTAEWLRPVHLVECGRLWLTINGGRCHWTDSVRLVNLSVEIANRAWRLPRFRDATSLAKLFTASWGLDYRSPLVRDLGDICTQNLMQSMVERA